MVHVVLKSDDLMEALVAEFIGRGGSREVFAVKDDPHTVIKAVHLPFVGANMLEHFLWVGVSETEHRDIFGCVHAISTTGRYLQMERLDDISTSDYPNVPNIPIWMNDVKPENFGKSADGRVKIRDYAISSLGKILSLGGARPVAWAGGAR